MFNPSAKIAAKVESLTEALVALSPGQGITYNAMSRVVGERITGSSYIMQRALKQAEQQSGCIFDNVHGKGYQRLATGEIPSIGKKANGRIRRTARKTRKRLEGVRANDLTTAEVGTIAAYRSHFGMLENLAKEQTVKAVEKAVNKEPFAPPKQLAARMAEMMKK